MEYCGKRGFRERCNNSCGAGLISTGFEFGSAQILKTWFRPWFENQNRIWPHFKNRIQPHFINRIRLKHTLPGSGFGSELREKAGSGSELRKKTGSGSELREKAWSGSELREKVGSGSDLREEKKNPELSDPTLLKKPYPYLIYPYLMPNNPYPRKENYDPDPSIFKIDPSKIPGSREE